MAEKISHKELAEAPSEFHRKYQIAESPRTEHDANLELLNQQWNSEPIENPIKITYQQTPGRVKDLEGNRVFFNAEIDPKLLEAARKRVQKLSDLISKIEGIKE